MPQQKNTQFSQNCFQEKQKVCYIETNTLFQVTTCVALRIIWKRFHLIITTTIWNEVKHLFCDFWVYCTSCMSEGHRHIEVLLFHFSAAKTANSHSTMKRLPVDVSNTDNPIIAQQLRTMVCHFIWSHTAHNKVWKWVWEAFAKWWRFSEEVSLDSICFLKTKLQVSHRIPQNETAGGAVAGMLLSMGKMALGPSPHCFEPALMEPNTVAAKCRC